MHQRFFAQQDYRLLGRVRRAFDASVVSALCTPVRRTFTTDPPSPFAASRGDNTAFKSAVTDVPQTSSSPSSFAAPANLSFSLAEIRALTFSLIPVVTTLPNERADPNELVHADSVSVSQLFNQLPRKLRMYMNHYQRSASEVGAEGELPCAVYFTHSSKDEERSRNVAARLLNSGIGAFLVDHFAHELVVFMPAGRLARKPPPASDTAAEDEQIETQRIRTREGNAASSELEATAAPSPPTPIKARTVDLTAAPPPPQPQGPSQRYNDTAGVVTSGFAFGGAGGGGATVGGTNPTLGSSAAPTPLRSSIQVMEVLVEYIPTFYVSIENVASTIPTQVQELYTDTNFRFFLKRFRHYVEMRTNHGMSEIRLKSTFDHPRHGAADARFRVGGGAASGAAGDGTTAAGATSEMLSPLRRPPRNSEANLIGIVGPQVPKEFTPLADVLQDIAPIISRHPAFDSRLGVMGLLGKYPEYFQIVDGKLRARPYRVAPNSVAEHDAETSPMPATFAKVLACVSEAAEGKKYSDPTDKTAAMVSTGRLYSLLTPLEKTQVKQKCRSFPTFLRMHGKDLVVSADKMRVYKFIPEYEACVDTLLDERLRMNSLDPNDPILKIPTTIADEADADWAVRELYAALPLMQCAELDEVLSLVPSAVRDALPKELSEVQTLLGQYSEYFTTWPYPDDPTIVVVQRAKVEQPVLDKSDIMRMVVPLIPQGGTTLASLRTRAPLLLQRYFYCHGTVKTLGAMTDVFAIAGDRIVRMA